jgi:hypothetical protein
MPMMGGFAARARRTSWVQSVSSHILLCAIRILPYAEQEHRHLREARTFVVMKVLSHLFGSAYERVQVEALARQPSSLVGSKVRLDEYSGRNPEEAKIVEWLVGKHQ